MMADRTLDIMVSAPVHLVLIVAFLYMAWVVTPPRIRKQLGVQAATPMPPSISPAHRQMWSASPTRQDTNEVSDTESPSPKQSPVLSRRHVQPFELLDDTSDFLHDDNRVVPTWSAEDFDARKNDVAPPAFGSDNDAREDTVVTQEGVRSTGEIAMHKVQRKPATHKPTATTSDALGDAHAAARTIQSAWRSNRTRRLSYNATGHAGKSHSPSTSRRPSVATALAAAAASTGVTTATASVAAEVETDALLRDLKRRGSLQGKTGRQVVSRGSVGVSSGGLRTSPAKVSSQHRRVRAATIALRGRDSIGLSGDEPVQRRPVDASPWRRFGSRVVDNDGSAAATTPATTNGETVGVGDAASGTRAGGVGNMALTAGMVATWELMVAGSTALAGGALAVEFVALLLRWLGVHSRVDALGTIADSILAADAGITCADAAFTKRHRQPQWAILLQITAALRVWILCEVVENFASIEGTLPARWFKYVRLVRLLALPSVVCRWEMPGELAGVGTAALGVLLVVLGVDMVAGALWARPVDALSIVFGLVLLGTGAGALMALHHAVSRQEEQQRERRMSVVEESLFAHRHTLSARRACVAKAFGPAVGRNEAVSGAVAKRFRCATPSIFPVCATRIRHARASFLCL